MPDGEEEPFCWSIWNARLTRGEDLAWITEIGLQGSDCGAECVQGGDGQQRRTDAVTADVEQVEGEVLVVEPVVTERVAAQVGGGDESPVGPDRSFLSFSGRSDRTYLAASATSLAMTADFPEAALYASLRCSRLM